MSDADPFALPTSEVDRVLTISDSAVKRITKLRDLEGDDQLMLRITVSGGGCSGFQYAFDFDKNAKTQDMLFEKNGVTVVTDETSMDLLAGSEVDFVDDLMGAYFQINNPNATASCGCGTSFSV
ncbi:iron-sulfur cluster insertion protein ErpA [Curvivirga aplysinae]|uniref:iron-sulfur cluster insertion protein ErpA n=1 Tax=Curvivirga aplysinae TaxID=2529852 RepID=UPI0012BC2602|nr:iron-sulfur cluster insertion protein ErpA [Curvivirga aplysinae]MTI10695.1 iron-sulfur cluster insertion protein ErpA [Curvivirga aplysinae]